jgi:hypothetical protein
MRNRIQTKNVDHQAKIKECRFVAATATILLHWVVLLGTLSPAFCRASDGWSIDLTEEDVQQIANGALTIMSFTLLPDITTSSLSIDSGTGDDATLMQTTFGGGFTISEKYPLYAEGTLGYTRYRPTFVATNGDKKIDLRPTWNSLSATGGVGWDFPIDQKQELVLRPMLNFTLGYVASDLSIAQALLEEKSDLDLNIIDGPRMNVYGLGSSVMLDYERYRADHQIDVELRYTLIKLQTLGNTTSGLKGKSETNTAGIWARWRAPLNVSLLKRPVRYVLESSYTTYFGPQRGALGFNHLTSLGAGVELDSSAYPVLITRTRLVGRYMFGKNVSGFSVGLAVSF